MIFAIMVLLSDSVPLAMQCLWEDAPSAMCGVRPGGCTQHRARTQTGTCASSTGAERSCLGLSSHEGKPSLEDVMLC